MAVDKRKLRELLVSSYNKGELVTIATDIAENAELVFSDGGTLETWARELIEWCARRNQLEILIDYIEKDRPTTYRDYEKPEIKSKREGIEAIFGYLRSVEVKEESNSFNNQRSAKQSPKLSVFLCHSSHDKPIVREFYQRLSVEGWIDPWLDEEKLLPGMDWNMEIQKAVEKADAVMVFLSSNSVTKEGYVQKELKYVLDIALEKPEGTIFIIPVRLEDCQPPRSLRTWQWIDIFPTGKKNLAMQRIIESLKIRALR